jgi:hypothetical protein
MTEKDPNGKGPHEAGAKLDDGKIIASTGLIDYFPHALMAVADVSTFGAKKYVEGGWKTVPDGERRYRNAGARHQLKRAEGEYIDADSGKLHIAHQAWCVLAELELYLCSYEQKGVVNAGRKSPLTSSTRTDPPKTDCRSNAGSASVLVAFDTTMTTPRKSSLRQRLIGWLTESGTTVMRAVSMGKNN